MVLLMIDKQGEWKEITKEEKEELPEEERIKVLYLDGFLKKKLDFALKQQKKDNDVVGIVGGDEGSGKSTLAAHMMRYISKDSFDPKLDMVGSNYEDGIEKIDNREQGSSLMFDEGNVFFLSTEVMHKESKNLHKLFSIFRQKNLFILIVLPSFFRLGTYFSLDRSRFLVRTYLKKGQRSYFAFYGDKRKAKLYYKGKKDHNYKAIQPNFRGRFQTCYLLDDPDYKKFKLQTLRKSIRVSKIEKPPSRTAIKRDLIKQIALEKIDLSSLKIARVLGCSDSTIRKIRQKHENDSIPLIAN